MSNPTISQITLPSGTTYEIKDAVARQGATGAIIFRGTTTSTLTDGASTNPIVINGENYTALNGDLVICGNKELVYSTTDNAWHEFGDTSGLGDLAVKDDVTATYTPAGSVSAPTISVDAPGSTASVTPFGTAGSLPSLTMTVNNENLSISFDQGSLPTAGSAVTVKTGDASYTADAPSFTGTQATITST